MGIELEMSIYWVVMPQIGWFKTKARLRPLTSGNRGACCSPFTANIVIMCTPGWQALVFEQQAFSRTTGLAPNKRYPLVRIQFWSLRLGVNRLLIGKRILEFTYLKSYLENQHFFRWSDNRKLFKWTDKHAYASYLNI